MEEWWVDRHRKEIEEVAHKLWEMRQRYNQEDDPQGNFLRAIEIVAEKYDIASPNNRKWLT